MTQRVLILCTGNCCRSQMAEGIWNHEAQGAWQACSAGARPAGYVHPQAIRALAEIGIDIAHHESKHVDQFKDQSFDLVVTVCDRAQAACPVFPGAQQTLHWPFDDPFRAPGDEPQKLEAFRRVRDQIRARIREYLSASHDREARVP